MTRNSEKNMTISVRYCQVMYFMSNVCKDSCKQYRAKVPANRVRYANGQKFCSVCKVYVIQDDIRCLCCGTKLRTRPRTTQGKKTFSKMRGGYGI